MKRLLITLIAVLTLIAPWRLLTLGTEALVMRAGNVRTSPGTDKYWLVQDLEVRLRRFGWKVTYVKGLMDNANAFGMTIPDDRSILVDESLSWNERYSVLLHEAGHTQQPFRMTQEQAEVFAESVAALMADDGLREHARYLAGLKPNVVPTLAVLWPDVYRAAANLTE